MTRLAFLAACLAVVRVPVAIAEGPQASELVDRLLNSDELTEIQTLADTLAEYTLSDEDVAKMMEAAEVATSDSRRIALWHAIRYSRARVGRSFLLRTLPEAELSLRIEFIHTLMNPTPFDVPVLVAIYDSDAPEGRAQHNATDESDLREFFLRFALSDWREHRLTDWPLMHKRTPVTRVVSIRRSDDADAAKLRLITWLAINAHDVDAQLAAFHFKGHSWFKGYNQTVKEPVF